MSNLGNRAVSRRIVLGGIGGAAGALLAPAAVAHAAPRSIDDVARRLEGHLIELRRDIHRHPEAAGQEARTAALVARQLRGAGLDVTTGIGGHGVAGVLTGARPGRTIAYRADMDAVPPQDQIGGGPEVAHVCGHDLHTAVGVGVALTLARLRARLAGRLVFVFQPGEESLAGAGAMLDDGVFDSVRPEEIHALHCGPFPVGTFATTAGFGLPGQDRGTITLTGPDAAANAKALATDLAALGTVSRPVTSGDLENLVAEIERPGSALSRFVFVQAQPAGASVRVAYRCWPQERYPEVRAAIRRLAQRYGAADVTFPADPFPAMVCPQREGQALNRYLRRTIGDSRTLPTYAAVPFSGEDFALFLNRMPGTYTFLGVRRPDADIATSYPHFGTFDPDERAIGHGVRTMAGWLTHRTRS
ncbi:N-acyl-L-amino acid amidohydrolase [Actinoplanes cyaneus]|uniref:N-acyl-L-amino acid amidohydrolase n=1 Tax=Actinoplanes cyaneus TaxID=52696 RepID=A0A919IQ95_9ACTN|nr:amidohydrolase [Actinoplanes cyaneus]MCW2143967.1 amidohydrolase [Actinoplanes cyaneus]GID69774.1 N-acyl-L-amino acid amidohydrolase [Actinoplanes cyaneus]